MGYYTTYELEILEGAGGNYGIVDELRESSESAKYALESNGNCREECKWYSHEYDMRKFSEKHPDVLFKLLGEGEENGDLWHEYYQNGKMQRCKALITYNDYDASNLT